MTLSKDNIARFGLVSIGIVYVLVGVLTSLAALNLGGKQTGTKGAISYLSNQSLAQFLLAVMAVGLFSYAFWRFYQAILDTRNLGTDANALFTRAGYFTGGAFYGFLGFIALKLFLGGNYQHQQDLLIHALNSEYGSFFAVAFGLVLAGKSIFEIYFIRSKKFMDNLQSFEMNPKLKSTLIRFGIIGHSARSVVFAIMAFLTFRTGVTIRNLKVSTLTDAFQFLSYKFSPLILGVVAIGLSCYGLFMFVKAKYLNVGMD